MRKLESERIAEALKGELEAVRWKAGERLPSVAELRKRFGTGAFAVRHALQNLRDAGFITLRQNVGAVVTQKASKAWKGRVLFVAVGTCGSYFHHVLSMSVSQRLREHGWDCTTLFVNSGVDGSLDTDQIVRQIANGTDFVINLAAERQIAVVFDRAGVPYVVLNGYAREYPNAIGVVREDVSSCYDALIKTLKKRRVCNVLEFDFERVMDRSFKAQMATAGIAVRRVMCRLPSPFTLSDVKKAGYSAVKEFFAEASHRHNLPEVAIFDDDYLAWGGVAAMLEAGIRIPEDMCVVTHSNKGNELVLGHSVARIENDPESYGHVVADFVLKLLAGRKVAPPKIPLRFVPGESL